MSDHGRPRAELDPRYGRLIFEQMPHGIFTVDEWGRITSFNRAAERITGWSRDQVVGKPCSQIFRSDHCRDSCFLFHSIEGGESHRDKEVKIVRKDGSEVLVAVSTAALRGDDGAVIGGVEMMRDLREVVTLRKQINADYTTQDIVSKSNAMRGVRELLPLVAKSNSTVLIEGEPGTGKELVARAIHNLGPRRDKPFVAVNCGAIPETLVESELFGHVRGAFTDAKQDRPGRFAVAQGGSLLLDEIGELAPSVQVKLLRVLQEKEFTPLGSMGAVEADVRILAATNRDLSLEVMNGRFRQDLYFRLNIVRVAVPPLRARTGDIPLLVRHFIKRFNALQGRRISNVSDAAMASLMEYRYPGNVRELENAIEHAFVICAGATIGVEDLPPHIRNRSMEPPEHDPRAVHLGPLQNAEAVAINDALARHNGNRTRAAQELGISRNTLWRKMKKHGVT